MGLLRRIKKISQVKVAFQINQLETKDTEERLDNSLKSMNDAYHAFEASNADFASTQTKIWDLEEQMTYRDALIREEKKKNEEILSTKDRHIVKLVQSVKGLH